MRPSHKCANLAVLDVACAGLNHQFTKCSALLQWLICWTGACRPNLGIKAYNAGWHFDFNLAYVGAGFITPLSVNYSMMVGAIVSWGLAWPLLRNRAGDWYPAGLPSYSFQGAIYLLVRQSA